MGASAYSGAVYVFTQSADVWSQQGYVKASNAGFSDSFGTSVSLSEDTLAVGAPGEASAATGVNGDQNSDAAPYSGAVYVFTRSAGVWSQQAYVKASNAGFNDRFAASVSLSEDTRTRLRPTQGMKASSARQCQCRCRGTHSQRALGEKIARRWASTGTRAAAQLGIAARCMCGELRREQVVQPD